MKQRAYPFSITGIFLLLTAVLLCSCGIYTTTEPLNPPFSISVDSTYLYFSGLNDEEYFEGYNIYYKENPDKNPYDFFKVCELVDSDQYPTITANPSSNTVQYPVDTNDIRPQGESRSFNDLYYNFERDAYFFGVAAVGEEDQRSEIIDFGIWPNPASQ
jgi:hypothetical protein